MASYHSGDVMIIFSAFCFVLAFLYDMLFNVEGRQGHQRQRAMTRKPLPNIYLNPKTEKELSVPMRPTIIMSTTSGAADKESDSPLGARRDGVSGIDSIESLATKVELTPSYPVVEEPAPDKLATAGHVRKPRTFPILPRCSPDGPTAQEMLVRYPDTPLDDIVRYLVAKKGDVTAASEMLEKYNAWRREFFPLKRADVGGILQSNVLFHHGTARDGTPVMYFRGGMYDKRLGSPHMHVLAAAQCMDEALKCSGSRTMTLMLHVGRVPGGINAKADMEFIKAFAGVLTAYYPERLQRLIIYPLPWWGLTIWNMASVFLDKSTADKVVLVAGDVKSPPPQELFEYVDASEVPASCGGVDERPTPNMVNTLVA